MQYPRLILAVYICTMEFLNELNDAQREAVINTEGPSMIIAGAGSGKTRVLTYRIAALLEKGVPPYNILSLTFTNKAAREMKERIGSLVGESKAKSLWMGTFHSVFARILRSESEKLGYPSNFTIYDMDDAKKLIKAIVKEKGLDDKVYKPNVVLNRISGAKNNLLTPAAYLGNLNVTKEDMQSKKPEIGNLYKIYNDRLFRSGAMDFDDLLFNMNILLRDFPEVLHKYQDRFRYILVDEYQDTNFSQYVIVKALADRFQNISVVGDDAQSIYAFRGASIQNILNFKKDYSDAKTYKLEQNYRSTQHIVKAANSLIENNQDQIKKKVWTSNDEGGKITVMGAMSDSEEALGIAHSIFHKKQTNQLQNSEFAILYRTNAQSRGLEDALRKLNIKYRIYGGLSFYQRKEIKDFLAYCRLVFNGKDAEALKRIINYPARGIGKTTMDKIELFAAENNLNLWDLIQNLDNAPIQIHSGAKNKIAGFVEMIKSFKNVAKTQDAYEAGKIIASSTGILKELHNDKTPEGIGKHDNVQEMLNSLKDFIENPEDMAPTLANFIQDIPLLTDKDAKTDDEDDDKVTLMTIHASKGLEFGHVYVAGLEENLFPSQLSVGSRTDLEEERRLFYVAITRAETSLTISYANMRYKWGDLISTSPSRFLNEIDKEYLDFQETGTLNKTKPTSTRATKKEFQKTGKASFTSSGSYQAPAKPHNMTRVTNTATSSTAQGSLDIGRELKAGVKVQHERFGIGTVAQVEGSAPNQKVTVEFINSGKRQLLLKFAKLTILS
ncbi:MAG: DNA helicase-2/ATP-dependent DNA helicase PcrA [Salibacteraceae bacterium]|jgi:DNA helicase-2/ATP-dependent DNA helicase PcrA